MELKHTPGEWNNRPFGIKRLFQLEENSTTVMNNDDTLIAIVGGQTDEELEANAKLMAAAPDLLRATERSLEIFKKLIGGGRLTMPAEDYNLLENAINKATNV